MPAFDDSYSKCPSSSQRLLISSRQRLSLERPRLCTKTDEEHNLLLTLTPKKGSELIREGEAASEEEEECLESPRLEAGDWPPLSLQTQRLLELQEQVQKESWIHLHLQE